ncbi:MAG: cobalt ABC transporter permease [Nitrospirota bacterium]|jgi:hypothetical protein
MKFQISNFKFQIFLTLFLLFTIHCSLLTTVFASEKWPGVDESVVEKYAKEHGREAMTPLINTDQGDLLLFVFLIAGTVGGFAAGYYWRTLTEQRPKNADVIKKNI